MLKQHAEYGYARAERAGPQSAGGPGASNFMYIRVNRPIMLYYRLDHDAQTFHYFEAPVLLCSILHAPGRAHRPRTSVPPDAAARERMAADGVESLAESGR